MDNADIIMGLNTVWVLVTGFLVFFMQAGFGLLEAGLTRAKNACNILTKNFLDFCMASLGFWAIGYAIMYGAGNGFIGKSGFFLAGLAEETAGIPTLAFWFFQAVFCGAAATIVAGAMAERMKFPAYLAYSFFISILVYPVVGHWIWGGGWLANLGFKDFAGSAVVHSVGGWASFVGTWMLRPRIGKYAPDGRPNAIPGHSIPLAALGVLILWFGWFGFNPGSSLSGLDAHLIALVATNTNLAAAAGGIISMFVVWAMYGKPDLSMTMNGTLAGLVAITAPCAFVRPGEAVVIGLAAGVLVVLGANWLDRIHIDDPVGAVPVHGMCGVLGVLAIGFFDGETGLFHGGGVHQLAIQSLGIVAVVAWVLGTMFVIFKVIDKVIGLRVSAAEEMRGLDLGEHGMESYAGFQIFTTQ